MAGTEKRSRGMGSQFIRFFKPIIEILIELGGSGKVAEVIDLVIEKMEIPESEQEITLKSGQSRVRNQIQWARLYLAYAGYIDASKRGVWSLTEKGQSVDTRTFDPLSLFNEVKKNYKKGKRLKSLDKPVGDTDEEEIELPDHRTNLLKFFNDYNNERLLPLL
jgi:restriction system protein